MKKFALLLAMLFVLALIGGCAEETIVAAPASATPTPTPTPKPTPSVEPDAPPRASYDGPSVVVEPAAAHEGDIFGLVRDEYTLDGATCFELGDVAGDTDLLCPKSIGATHESLSGGTYLYGDYPIYLPSFTLAFDAAMPISFTCEKYENGELVDDLGIVKAQRAGTIERYNDDGSWSSNGAVYVRTPGVAAADYASDLTPTLVDGKIRIMFPSEVPGVYRYNMYFRELLDADPETRTTGDELYEISFIVVAPESEAEFSVIAVAATAEIIEGNMVEEYNGREALSLNFVVRSREDYFSSPQYTLGANLSQPAKLEQLVGEEWVEVADATAVLPKNDTTGRDRISSGALVDRYINGMRPALGSETPTLISYSTSGIFTPEFGGKYRITLPFTDDYDVTTYQTICFDFDK